jgi:hypothetical protein
MARRALVEKQEANNFAVWYSLNICMVVMTVQFSGGLWK